MATEISNSDDVIDSRDVIARIKELEEERVPLAEAVVEAQTAVDDLDKEDENEDEEEALDTLEAAQEALEEWDNGDEGEELRILKELAEEGESATSEWANGETLINDDYFEKYAREFAEDIGAISRDTGWPCNHINWEEAAEDLQQDFTRVDFDGQDFWIRSN